MPETKNALTRYRIIDNRLNNHFKKAPSLTELAEICSDSLGKFVSPSTIEKDLRIMRHEYPKGYGAPIVYDKFQRGYIYTEKAYSINALQLEDCEWEGLSYISNLLHQYNNLPIFRAFENAVDKIHRSCGIPIDHNSINFHSFVQIGTGYSSSGYKWIGHCYTAIRNRQKAKIKYEHIYQNKIKYYEFQPCLLKEYKNRWYVIGRIDSKINYLTLALDCIKEITIIPNNEIMKKGFDYSHLLHFGIGMINGDTSSVFIELELLSPADKIITLDPLHITQVISKVGKGSISVSLKANLNPELYQRILSLGPLCKIKKPAKLKQAIKMQLEQTLRYYL